MFVHKACRSRERHLGVDTPHTFIYNLYTHIHNPTPAPGAPIAGFAGGNVSTLQKLPTQISPHFFTDYLLHRLLPQAYLDFTLEPTISLTKTHWRN